MATFVLIHGAFHGGWCWKKVVPLLRAAGHEVYTPTLTGLGERAHLLTAAVDLETHVQDVVGVLTYEDLDHAVLVGHSYGGVVITGVADRVAARLAHLVYLDAVVPADGQSRIDFMSPEQAAALRTRAKADGDGWWFPPLSLEHFGVTEEADLRWATPRVTPQPLATFEQPVQCPSEAAALVPRTYIRCVRFPNEFYDQAAAQARATPGWRYRELLTGHDAMISAPQALADLLVEVV